MVQFCLFFGFVFSCEKWTIENSVAHTAPHTSYIISIGKCSSDGKSKIKNNKRSPSTYFEAQPAPIVVHVNNVHHVHTAAAQFCVFKTAVVIVNCSMQYSASNLVYDVRVQCKSVVRMRHVRMHTRIKTHLRVVLHCVLCSVLCCAGLYTVYVILLFVSIRFRNDAIPLYFCGNFICSRCSRCVCRFDSIWCIFFFFFLFLSLIYLYLFRLKNSVVCENFDFQVFDRFH